MVRFDHCGRAAKGRNRFDDVGVQSALGKKFGPFYFFGFGFENFHEDPADDFAFFFGIGYFRQRVQKALFGVDKPNVQTQVKF